ncbi:MAG: NfeD family protein [Myxococcota bacterium]
MRSHREPRTHRPRWLLICSMISLLCGLLLAARGGAEEPNTAGFAPAPPLAGAASVPDAAPGAVPSSKPAASESGSDVASPAPLAQGAAPAQVAQDSPNRVMVLTLNGGIFGGTAQYLISNIERAEAEGLPVLVILDTPGGALDATREIVKSFLGAKVPILLWVGPSGARAGSAGVFLTMASHVAVMAPGTNIGAAHPVGGGVGAPGDEAEEEAGESNKRKRRDEQEVMAQKIENDTLAFIESIANARNRNAEWALSAVKDSASVTADKALELKVIDLIARDVPSLLEAVDGRTVETVSGPVTLRLKNAEQLPVPMSLRQRLLAFLSDPNLVYILMALGMMGLYLEFNHPGLIIPAVLGGICLILALTGLSVLPYNATGLIFFVLAIACFVAETYVSSFGLLALGGAASLVMGAILLFESPPDVEGLPGLEVAVSPSVYGTVALTSIAIALPVAYLVARVQRRKPVSGREGLLAQTGKTLTPIDRSSGRIFAHGEYWEARSEQLIPEGVQVSLVKLEGLTLWVKPLDERM